MLVAVALACPPTPALYLFQGNLCMSAREKKASLNMFFFFLQELSNKKWLAIRYGHYHTHIYLVSIVLYWPLNSPSSINNLLVLPFLILTKTFLMIAWTCFIQTIFFSCLGLAYHNFCASAFDISPPKCLLFPVPPDFIPLLKKFCLKVHFPA